MTYFITGNKGKFEELKLVLPELEQLDIDLPEIQELDPDAIIAAKLQSAFAHHQGPFIVEDTSLYFDCLNGLPGPLVKWFLKTLGNSGLADLVHRFDNNAAQAKTVIGYAEHKDNVNFFEGVVAGRIVAPQGEGFGWDPIFVPTGSEKTFGQMTREEKQEFSMRRIAAEKLRDYLAQKPT